jgi:glucan phosphorylase
MSDLTDEEAAQEQQQALGLLGQEGQLISDMSDRRYAHQKWMRDLKLGQYAQMRQDASANISGGIGTLASSAIDAASMMGTTPRADLSYLDPYVAPSANSVLKSIGKQAY